MRWTMVLALGATMVGCDGDDGGTSTGADSTVADTAGDAGGKDVQAGDAGGGDDGTPGSDVADTATYDTGGVDAGPLDGGTTDGGTADAGPGDTGPDDAGTTDGGGGDAGSDAAQDAGLPEGFEIRIPGSNEITCPGVGGGTETFDQPDADHVCTFAHGGSFGQLYVQASASGCAPGGFGGTPIYDVVGAWMAMDGKVVSLAEPGYDWGGNHHNDFITFSWGGTKYKVYHSSFGWGWRACQPPDCMQVLSSGGAVVEDGCTKDRTLPVVCVLVEADGTVPPLVDTFEPCEGDPNYQ